MWHHAVHLSHGVTLARFLKPLKIDCHSQYFIKICQCHWLPSQWISWAVFSGYTSQKFYLFIYLFENHLTYKNSRHLFLSFRFWHLNTVFLILTALATNYSFWVIVFIHKFNLQWCIDASQILTPTQSSVFLVDNYRNNCLLIIATWMLHRHLHSICAEWNYFPQLKPIFPFIL